MEVVIGRAVVTVTVPLFEPDVGLMVNQLGGLEIVQLVFEVMLKVSVRFASAEKLSDVLETDKLYMAPPCVTVIVFGAAPSTEMLIVAVLAAVNHFS